jgi:predicted PurR-regulated permease PerM
VLVAFVFKLILSPVVRFLKRLGLADVISAVLLLALLVVTLATAAYWLSGPITTWVEDAPRIAYQIERKLAGLIQPLAEVQEATKEVEEATDTTDEGTEQVVVQEPGFLMQMAGQVPGTLGAIGLTLVLLFFLLASGDMFYEKLIRVLPGLQEKKRGLRIVQDIEQEVARYLFTITLINIALGVVMGTGLYFLGLPNPALWGVGAAILNYAPYVGPAVGIVVIGAVAFVTLDSVAVALLAPLLYFACNIIEGQFAMPMLVGHRLRINVVAVFFAIAFWGWLWGVIGVLIAVPLLILIKIVSLHVPALSGLNEFLGAPAEGTQDHARAPGGRAPSQHG